MSTIRVPHLGQDGQALTDGKYLRCSAIFSTLLLAERDTDADFRVVVYCFTYNSIVTKW